ncbi:phage terminase large subunit [Borrelia sp. RT1S]|uniref:phage terminase large subunit n=1 Tax=Borrelia sp. RT1S TaxID=2898580 RepID=UPI001E63BD59|nr:phage terminase large subunit [Borrelia sp. RT1S]UGQ17883.1 phage terminase large subunit [Borrelia sp. RT1S]
MKKIKTKQKAYFTQEVEALQKWALSETLEAYADQISEPDMKERLQIKSFKDLQSALQLIRELANEMQLITTRNSDAFLHFKTFIPKFAMLHYSYNKARHKVIASPRGLGKTHNSARIFLQYLLEQDNDMTWFRYTESAVYESFVKLFSNIIAEENLENLFKIQQNKNNDLWEIRCKISNSVLDFRGAFSPHALKGIEGKNKLLFDEATEFSIDSMLKIEGSIKKDNKIEFWYCFNHGSQSKFNKIDSKDLIEGMKKRGAYFLKLEPQDNIYLDESYFQNLEGFKYLSPQAYYEATGKIFKKEEEVVERKPLNIMSRTIKRKFSGF